MGKQANIMNRVGGFIQYKHISNILPAINLIPYAIIKGAVLSYYAYGDYGKRAFKDTDLLVDRKMIADIEKILRSNDFLQVNYKNSITKTDRQARAFCMINSHQILPYYRFINDQPICFDINFDLFWGEYEGKRIDVERFLSDTIEMEIYGVKVKTLPPIKAMIHLILHQYKDINSLFLLATRKSIRYDMFKDVYYLLKNNLDAISLDKLCAMSAEYEIIPYVFYILYYTGQVFDDDVLKQYIEAFRTPEGEALLNCYGLCEKERREWKCDFKTRLDSDHLYELIKDDLTERDKEKIAINKRIFLGISE